MTHAVTITVAELATKISKGEEEFVLPNGQVRKGLSWKGEDLASIARVLHNAGHSGEIRIDGGAPAWLHAAVAHEIHPGVPVLNTPEGFILASCKAPSPTPEGDNLHWEVNTRPDGWTMVEVSQVDPSQPLDLHKVGEVAPPELPFGSKVIVSGRLPNLFVVAITMAYHGKTKAVACLQKGIGATVCQSHTPSVKLGALIPE